jgi:MarR family transcriptional regulator for hemolysin
MGAVSLLSQAKILINLRFQRRLTEEGLALTAEQWVLLSLLAGHEGISQSELARLALKDKTNVTRMVDLLERDALLRRIPDPGDRRVCRIALTDGGRELLRRAEPVVRELEETSLGGFTAGERELLEGMLSRVCRNFTDGNS